MVKAIIETMPAARSMNETSVLIAIGTPEARYPRAIAQADRREGYPIGSTLF
jgi:hypothetical protein